MRGKTLIFLLAIAAIAVFPVQARGVSILGSAESYAVLGGSTVTNTDTATMITGNVGVSPGSAITGFPPGLVSGGMIQPAGVSLAQSDLTAAYVGLAGMAYTSKLTDENLGGLTLTSGVYYFPDAAQLTGTLTLDAEHNNNAFWVFQIGKTLTTASSSSVNVINPGSNNGIDDGVFWQVGSSATLGTSTTFEGNILALTSITLTTGATIGNGRALARNGAVTLDANVISIVCPNGGPGYSGGLEYQNGKVVPVSAPIPEPGTCLVVFSGLVSLCAYVKKTRFRGLNSDAVKV